MRYLITGANGMLGTALCKVLYQAGVKVFPTDVMLDNGMGVNLDSNFMDICDMRQVSSLFEKVGPDFVFHLAAATDVDRCELQPEYGQLINVLGTENIVKLCERNEIPMAYISTGSVFDGTKLGTYSEIDTPNPINHYAKTKLAGEHLVVEALDRFYIFRAGWMMGGNGKDKKFVGKMVDLLNTRDEVSVVNDKFGSPTYTVDFSKGMLEVVKKETPGIYHLVNGGICSRYDIACHIRKYLGLNVSIKPVSSKEFPLPAVRPNNEGISSVKLEKLGLGLLMRDWQPALDEYLDVLSNK